MRHNLALLVVGRFVTDAWGGVRVFIPGCTEAKVCWVADLAIVVVKQLRCVVFSLQNWGAFSLVFSSLAILGHLIANKVRVLLVFVAELSEQVLLELFFTLAVFDGRKAILDCP